MTWHMAIYKKKVWLIVLAAFVALNLVFLHRHFGHLPTDAKTIDKILFNGIASSKAEMMNTDNASWSLYDLSIGWISTRVNSSPKDIRVFVPVYKNTEKMETMLYSLFDSDIKKYSFEVYLINNFGYITPPPKLAEYVGKSLFLIDNTVRPAFSTGHLSRDWNTGLVQGFQDLDNPVSKIVILAQGDTQFHPNFASKLYDLHFKKGVEFIQQGHGDEFQSFLPMAVKRIGLYDERFCGIGFQENDYFIRAVMEYLDEPEKMSLYDLGHKRVFSLIGDSNLLEKNRPPNGYQRSDEDHLYSLNLAHPFANSFLAAKWPNLQLWSQLPNISTVVRISPAIPSVIIYPYFEKKILNLDKKGYIVPGNYRDL